MRVAEAVPVEEGELLVGVLLLGREAGRRRAAGEGRLVDVGRNGAGHVGVDAEQSRRRLRAHHVGDQRAPVAALRDVLRVAEAPHQLGPGAARCARAPSPVAVGLPEKP